MPSAAASAGPSSPSPRKRRLPNVPFRRHSGAGKASRNDAADGSDDFVNTASGFFQRLQTFPITASPSVLEHPRLSRQEQTPHLEQERKWSYRLHGIPKRRTVQLLKDQAPACVDGEGKPCPHPCLSPPTMSKPSPAQFALAKQLLAREVAILHDPAAAAASLYTRMLGQLAPLIGRAGVHALLLRSAKLTCIEHPCLAEFTSFAIHKEPQAVTSHAGQLRVCLQAQLPLITMEPAEVLFGNLLSLLAAFIGDRLTAQVLEDAWPSTSATAPSKGSHE
jgi:hypothetical protein